MTGDHTPERAPKLIETLQQRQLIKAGEGGASVTRPNAGILWPALEQPVRLGLRDLGLVLITIAIVLLIVQLVLDKSARSGWAGWLGLGLLTLTLVLLVLQRRTHRRL